VLVCAPSNVAVDQLAEKISATGLKVSGYFVFLLTLQPRAMSHMNLNLEDASLVPLPSLSSLEHANDKCRNLRFGLPLKIFIISRNVLPVRKDSMQFIENEVFAYPKKKN